MILEPRMINFLAAFLVIWISLFITLAFIVAPTFREILIGSALTLAQSVYIWFFRRKSS